MVSMQKINRKIKKRILSILIILLGNTGLAVSVQLFVVPNELITGGVAGLGLFFQNIFPAMPLSVFTFVFNMLMFLLGLVVLGKTFALTTLLSSVYYPIALGALEFFCADVKLTNNDLLAALYGGIILGISLGLVIREGASTGGFDIPELIVHKYMGIPISVLVYAVDFLILLLQAVRNSSDTILYGIAMVFVCSICMDKVLLIGTKKTQMKIISNHYEEIRQAIIREADRGVTVLYGETGYLRENVHMLLTVMSNREVAKMRRIIEEIDEEAFIAVSEVSEVRGRGFTLDKDYHKEEKKAE